MPNLSPCSTSRFFCAGMTDSPHTEVKKKMNSKFIVKVVTGVSAVTLLAGGCATNPDGSYAYQKTAFGALGGGALGAGVGALIGGKTHRGRNAAIGGLTGAAVGGGVGYYMDRQ